MSPRPRRSTLRALGALACTLAVSSAALAAPPPVPPADDKSDAQALVATGMKQYAAKDYTGALASFRDAYAHFASTKILLDIATTLAHLGRDADAANAYQRYLDAPDNDASKRAGVTKALADLDRKLAIVTVNLTPADAEVQIAGGDWLPASAAAHYRVAPGPVEIHARKAGYTPGAKSIHVDEGEELSVALALAVAPPVVVTPVKPPPPPPPPAPAPRSRVGVIALAHVAVEHPGVAGLVGVEVDALPWLQLEATALVGKTSGGYVAAAIAPLPGRIRPFAAAGAPIFVSNGARVSLRGALGVELVATRNLSVVAEIGVEYALNPEADVEHTILVPALGLTGRL